MEHEIDRWIGTTDVVLDQCDCGQYINTVSVGICCLGCSNMVKNKVQVFLMFCVLVLCFRKVKDLSSTSGPGKSSMLSSKGITSLHIPAYLTRALSKFR